MLMPVVIALQWTFWLALTMSHALAWTLSEYVTLKTTLGNVPTVSSKDTDNGMITATLFCPLFELGSSAASLVCPQGCVLSILLWLTGLRHAQPSGSNRGWRGLAWLLMLYHNAE